LLDFTIVNLNTISSIIYYIITINIFLYTFQIIVIFTPKIQHLSKIKKLQTFFKKLERVSMKN